MDHMSPISIILHINLMLSQARHKNVPHVQKSVIFFTLINLKTTKKKKKKKRVTRELTDQTHLLKLKVLINASSSFSLFIYFFSFFNMW
jgi:hypothetical protein